MSKDLTTSVVDRQNVLNNPYALAEIEKAAEAEAKGEKRRTAATPRPKGKGGEDPRSGLYAVN